MSISSDSTEPLMYLKPQHAVLKLEDLEAKTSKFGFQGQSL